MEPQIAKKLKHKRVNEDIQHAVDNILREEPKRKVKARKVSLDPIQRLGINEELARKLDDTTIFTHAFLKAGEEKNVIKRNDKRMNKTISHAMKNKR